MGALAVGLNAIGLDLDFVYLFMGILIGSAVVPLWNMLMWRKANASGAVAAAWGGMLLAVVTWLVTASAMYGDLSMTALSKNEPMLAGNVVAIGSSALIHMVCSVVRPQNYDFKSMAAIQVLDAPQEAEPAVEHLEGFEQSLKEAKAWILKRGLGFTAFVLVGWPMLCLGAGVFSKGFFSLWVFVSLVWGFAAAAVVIGLPLWESRDALLGVGRALLRCTRPRKDLAGSPGEGGELAGAGEGSNAENADAASSL